MITHSMILVWRSNAWLRPRGYGLLIHDGYRPWYVTKMFWDASPEDKHIFVADPALGSKHNRGIARQIAVFGKLHGDVDFQAVRDVASFITPVPGGIGPVTVAALMENVVRAAQFAHHLRAPGYDFSKRATHVTYSSAVGE